MGEDNNTRNIRFDTLPWDHVPHTPIVTTSKISVQDLRAEAIKIVHDIMVESDDDEDKLWAAQILLEHTDDDD